MSQMRWFTDEAYEADEVAWDAILTSYWAHVADIRAALPLDLAALASEPQLNLHDARIRRIIVDLEARTVVMTLGLAEDRGLELTFEDAVFTPENLQAVAYAVGATYSTDWWGTTRTTVLAQEIDIASGGRFLLRLRLWPFGELGLAFTSFSLEETAAPADDGRPGEFLMLGRRPEED